MHEAVAQFEFSLTKRFITHDPAISYGKMIVNMLHVSPCGKQSSFRWLV